MNALKLVGMSEGAKKRKARQSVVTHRLNHILSWYGLSVGRAML